MKNKIILKYLLLFIICLFITTVFAQQPNLTLTKVRNGKQKVVEIGNDLIIKKIGVKSKVEGKVVSISAESITLDSIAIPLDSIEEIIKPFEWRIAGMIVAVPVIAAGLIYTGFSALILTAGAIYNDNVMVIGGAIDVLIGAGILYMGLYPYTHKGRRFKIGKKWGMEVQHTIAEPVPVSKPVEDDYYVPPDK